MTVGRPTGRANLAFPDCQRLVFGMGYKYPSLGLFSLRILRAKIPIFPSILATSFQRVFGLKDLSFICF